MGVCAAAACRQPQEQLAATAADARAAGEREHALFIRTTVLEQVCVDVHAIRVHLTCA